MLLFVCQKSVQQTAYGIIAGALTQLYKDRDTVPNLKITSGHTLPMTFPCMGTAYQAKKKCAMKELRIPKRHIGSRS